MKKISFLFLSLICCILVNATTIRYVAPSGVSSGTGTTLATAMSFSFAVGNSSPVVAGDVVYCLAGTYSTTGVVFYKSGTNDSPISYIGYTALPGDQPPLGINKADPYATFSASDMPTFSGPDRTTGIGFDLVTNKCHHVVLKNFQVQLYELGVYSGSADSTGSHNTFENINVKDCGNRTSGYFGRGILLGNLGVKWSDYNLIKNCLVVNTNAEGIGCNGSHNTIDRCKVYCNDGVSNAFLDYYILVSSEWNTIKNCYIKCDPATGFTGASHGLTCKGNNESKYDNGNSSEPECASQHNTFINDSAINVSEGACVRHTNSLYNQFISCYFEGTHTGVNGSGGGQGNAIMIRDGASYNIFKNITGKNLKEGITFYDTSEDRGANVPNYNKIVNCWFANIYIGIRGTSGTASDAGDNEIAFCTFYKTRYTIDTERDFDNLRYNAIIFYGTSGTADGDWTGGSKKTDVIAAQFKDCDWYLQTSLGSMVASSTNGISTNPSFTNAASYDFTLAAGSGCIHTATTAAVSETYNTVAACQFATPNNNLELFDSNKYSKRLFPHILTDIRGKIRPNGSESRGCYEY